MLTNQPTKLANLSAIDEQLFTEVTPKQAAIIEGGKTLFLERIQAIRANADTFGQDDMYVTANGVRLFSQDMGTGETATINQAFRFNGSVTVQLFDADTGNDDNLGAFTRTNPTNGTRRRRVFGSGSTYDVFYSVFA